MDIQGKTIAVTGASGMIGIYICRSLLRAGAKVVGVVRNPAKAAFLAEEGVEFRTADLADVEAAIRALSTGAQEYQIGSLGNGGRKVRRATPGARDHKARKASRGRKATPGAPWAIMACFLTPPTSPLVLRVWVSQ